MEMGCPTQLCRAKVGGQGRGGPREHHLGKGRLQEKGPQTPVGKATHRGVPLGHGHRWTPRVTPSGSAGGCIPTSSSITSPRPPAAAPAWPGLLKEDMGRSCVPPPASFLPFVGCLCRKPVPARDSGPGDVTTSSVRQSRFLLSFPLTTTRLTGGPVPTLPDGAGVGTATSLCHSRTRLTPARRSPLYLGPNHKQGTRCPRRVSHPSALPLLHPHEWECVTSGMVALGRVGTTQRAGEGVLGSRSPPPPPRARKCFAREGLGRKTNKYEQKVFLQQEQ